MHSGVLVLAPSPTLTCGTIDANSGQQEEFHLLNSTKQFGTINILIARRLSTLLLKEPYRPTRRTYSRHTVKNI
jgi:hypothetical protein